MAKNINPLVDGFRIGDLINEDGVMFEIGDDINNNEDDEEFSYSPHVQFSNEEMLNMLNMNSIEDEDEDEKETVSLCGMSFSKLKTKMTSLTPNGKVMKYVKQRGVGEIIPNNAQAIVHYIGYFEYRDEPFDSTYSIGKPRSLRLGQSFIIPGLEIGIRSMQKHEIAIFLIHPDYAYKAVGCPPRIPPNEEVIFVVQLVDYIDDGCAQTYKNFTEEEKQSFRYVVQPVKHMFVAAKDYCTKFNYKQAIREYRKIADCLESIKLQNDLEEKEMSELLSRAYTNLGICHNKENMPTKACLALRKVPKPTAKSYYHYGQALLNIGEYNEAMKAFQKAWVLEPHDDSIRKAIRITNVKQREYLEIEKRLWKNCFRSNEEQIKVNEFRKAARDLCERLINSNDAVRQNLSEGFTKEEYEIIREEAAILGLNVVTSVRYGKETIFLQKSKS
ncbi:Peptidyl-prolyl cis-trans isomerase FKBP6 [Trachymyrmex zeteki]|uniref:peptidylprolyl isomerase n=1 Tax=Mycetomoellerius zeteki TaxID=64791 RepID=A0A151WU13_9HYME|nr:PREDICTED: inactive peptidyl-prolyl cis-trans isomerase FKBP6 isoform X1 [Trachymyrmex zeteki]XP_018309320.1 PREDICTED: inactive peptidyl-prolyl cis-trans isomerase FKBP6 isoform X1 [Trachymyrmex zeteki]XP_018309321.1 PREDICTED: inactive peptidyl-prolyl cis-trans isomerase FKBP6 isoform X1 [Trachymyrmex zeteki]KYQ51324.1 Peptidyl-prolyl cis-trans isomerase FKBP6 [Trachymyrmex zeteki]